jgi:hypothetical protein
MYFSTYGTIYTRLKFGILLKIMMRKGLSACKSNDIKMILGHIEKLTKKKMEKFT